MTVHPGHYDPKLKHSRTTCMDCVKIPLDVDGIDDSIDTQMMKKPNDLPVHLADLYYGRNPYIGTLKKERGDIFSEFCTKRSKAKFLRYVNKLLFEMVKIALKDTHLGGKTPTALKNKVSTCRKMYYDKKNWVMVNESVNEFYTRFLFKIDALPHDVILPLDIAATLFNNLSPNIRELLI